MQDARRGRFNFGKQNSCKPCALAAALNESKICSSDTKLIRCMPHAYALDFLKTDLKHAEFENASATIVLVRTIDKIFDILNSRYEFARGFKHPIRLQNLEYVEITFATISRVSSVLEIQ